MTVLHKPVQADRLRRLLGEIKGHPCPETSAAGREEWEKKRRLQAAEVESSLAEYVQAAENAERKK